MNYLCAFLLLAFAASSVHSKFCSSPDTYKPKFEEQFRKQCQSKFPFNLDTVPLLIPITILLDTITEVHGVLIEWLDTSVVLDNFKLHVEVKVNIGCDVFPAVSVLITIDAELNSYLEDGCGLLGLSSKPVVKLSIIGTPLNIDLTLIDAVLTAIAGHISKLVEEILDVVLLTVNCLAKSVTNVQIIGGERCNYELSLVEIVDGLFQGVCCLLTDEGPACSDNVVVELVEGAHSVVALTNNMLENILKLAIKGFNYQVLVPSEVSGDLVSAIGSFIHFRVSIIGIDACSFTPGGADMTISLKIELLSSDSVLLSATTTLDLKAKIDHGYGFWGLEWKASVSADLTLTVVEDVCGCQDSVSTWLKEMFTCNTDAIVAKVNAHVRLCLSLPVPSGIPPTNTKIVPQQGSCNFYYS